MCLKDPHSRRLDTTLSSPYLLRSKYFGPTFPSFLAGGPPSLLSRPPRPPSVSMSQDPPTLLPTPIPCPAGSHNSQPIPSQSIQSIPFLVFLLDDPRPFSADLHALLLSRCLRNLLAGVLSGTPSSLLDPDSKGFSCTFKTPE